jgi:hypothetical protein
VRWELLGRFEQKIHSGFCAKNGWKRDRWMHRGQGRLSQKSKCEWKGGPFSLLMEWCEKAKGLKGPLQVGGNQGTGSKRTRSQAWDLLGLLAVRPSSADMTLSQFTGEVWLEMGIQEL